MHMPKFLISFLALLLTSEATARERVFVISPMEGQQVEYDRGQEAMIVAGRSVTVAFSFYPENKKAGWISIAVQNASSEPFEVDEHSLRAWSGGQPLQVFTYQVLAQQQARREAWGSVAAALTAAGNSMNAANAGYSYNSGTYVGRTTAHAYGSAGYAYGTANTVGTYSGITYNPYVSALAQAEANQRNRQMLDQLSQRNQQARADLASRVLRRTTVSPGEIVTGQILVQLPRSGQLDVAFVAGGEQFPAVFTENGRVGTPIFTGSLDVALGALPNSAGAPHRLRQAATNNSEDAITPYVCGIIPCRDARIPRMRELVANGMPIDVAYVQASSEITPDSSDDPGETSAPAGAPQAVGKPYVTDKEIVGAVCGAIACEDPRIPIIRILVNEGQSLDDAYKNATNALRGSK